MPRIHFVIVHGAYHQAWHLHLLKQELENAGYSVSTPQLPSASHDPPADPFEKDKATIKHSIIAAASEADKVIPVFHSYTATVGCEAVAEVDEDVKAKIPRLVLLAAFMTEQGTTLASGSKDGPAKWLKIEGGLAIVPDPTTLFYHDVPPELAAEACKHIVPQTLEVAMVTTKHAGWSMFPVTFVQCTRDRALVISHVQAKQEMLLRGESVPKGWELVKLDSGHSPFLSMPEECALTLRRAAGEHLDPSLPQ